MTDSLSIFGSVFVLFKLSYLKLALTVVRTNARYHASLAPLLKVLPRYTAEGVHSDVALALIDPVFYKVNRIRCGSGAQWLLSLIFLYLVGAACAQ